MKMQGYIIKYFNLNSIIMKTILSFYKSKDMTILEKIIHTYAWLLGAIAWSGIAFTIFMLVTGQMNTNVSFGIYG